MPDSDVPSLQARELTVPHQQLEEWLERKPRSHNFWEDVGDKKHRIFVEKETKDSYVKITQWNSNCAKTVYGKPVSGKHDRRKLDDRVSIHHYDEMPEKYNLVIIVLAENMVMPNQSSAPTEAAVTAGRRGTFNRKSRKAYEERVAHVCMSDRRMWSELTKKPMGKAQTLWNFGG